MWVNTAAIIIKMAATVVVAMTFVVADDDLVQISIDTSVIGKH
jgi:hypothetical protein